MKNHEYASAQRRCLNQCSRPTDDLKDGYPSLQPKDYSDEKVAAILTANVGVFEIEFGLQNLLNYLWCQVYLLAIGSPDTDVGKIQPSGPP